MDAVLLQSRKEKGDTPTKNVMVWILVVIGLLIQSSAGLSLSDQEFNITDLPETRTSTDVMVIEIHDKEDNQDLGTDPTPIEAVLPSRVVDFKVLDVTSTSVTLEWRHDLDYMDYCLKYNATDNFVKNNDTKVCNCDVQINNTTNTYIVQNLIPNTNYTFSISKMESNHNICGEPSELIVNTKKGAPLVEFVDFQVLMMKGPPPGLNVSWQINPNDIDVTLDGFEVSWENNLNRTTRDAATSDRNALVENLAPWTDYNIKVCAYNSEKTGEKVYKCSRNITRRTYPLDGYESHIILRANTTSNSSIQLTWETSAEPRGPIDSYSITFKKNDTADGPLGKIVLNNTMTWYEVTSLDPWTAYEFTLVPSGVVDNVTFSGKNVTATNRTFPGRPTDSIALEIVNFGSKKVRLRWTQHQKPNGPIDGYVLEYNKTEENGDIKRIFISGGRTTFAVENLTSWTTYTISIKAYNNFSGEMLEGPEATITVQTKPEKPEPIKDLKVTGFDHQSVQLVWSPPDVPNGPINGYLVYVNRSVGSSDEVFETNVTEYEIRDLQPWIYYKFTIRAFNLNGTKKLLSRNSTIVVRTDAAIPRKPQNVKVTNTTSKSIALSWEYPFPNPGPLSYTVMIYGASEGSCSTNELLQNVTEGLDDIDRKNVTIDNLSPYTEYCFIVVSRTKAGHDTSEPLTARTDPEIPLAPSDLKILDLKPRQFRLEWKKPDIFTGPANYTVYVFTLEKDKSCQCPEETSSPKTVKVWDVVGWNNTSVLVENLHPFTIYCITVLAVNEAGKRCSNSTTVKTPMTNPSPPRNFRAKTINSTAIELTWKSPKSSFGPLDGYILNRGEENEVEIPSTQSSFVDSRLLPYTNYTFTLMAYNNWENKTRLKSEPVSDTAQTAIAVPTQPSNVTIIEKTFHSLSVQWQPPVPMPGPTNYIVRIFSGKDGICSDKLIKTVDDGLNHWSSNKVSIEELDPYTEYCLDVVAVTEAGTSSSDPTVVTRTDPGIPETPKQLNPAEVRSREILLNWEQPSTFIGPTNYTIYVSNEDQCRDFSALDEKPPHNEFATVQYAIGWNNTSILILSLEPFTNYCIGVCASTDTGSKCSGTSEVIQTSPDLPEAPEGLNVTCYGKPTVAHLAWGPPNVTNGILELYAVMYSIVQRMDENTTELSDEKLVLLNSTSIGEKFQCGDGDCKGIIDGLHPERHYLFQVQAKTKDVDGFGPQTEHYGCYTSPLKSSDPPSSATGPIVGVLSFLILLVAAGLFAYLQREKLRKLVTNARGRTRPILAPLEVVHMSQPYGQIRPVKISEFSHHVSKMLSDSSLRFSQEYEELRSTKFTYHTTAAQISENRQKNRWVNILPFDQSRVKLLPIDDDPASDYINASYIPGYNSPREYIATQGPLPGTLDDFWRMIWEQGVTMIVMLTQCVERGKKKCEQYWHSDHDVHCYGDLQVRTRSESVLSGYTIRLFDVQLGDRERLVKQMHFTKWPDFGCPENTQVLINFVRAVRDHLPHTNPGPIVVHCSAGVGRTGTFIAVDRLLRHIEDHEYIDVFTTVLEMRQHRPNMVQTEDQYIYIHECLRDAIEERKAKNINSESAIYNNGSFEMEVDSV